MTTIIVKPAKENSRARRYRQRGELMTKRREDAELARKISKAWAKLTHVERPTQKEEYAGSCCLPEVAIYRAGHRKSSDSVTAR